MEDKVPVAAEEGRAEYLVLQGKRKGNNNMETEEPFPHGMDITILSPFPSSFIQKPSLTIR